MTASWMAGHLADYFGRIHVHLAHSEHFPFLRIWILSVSDLWAASKDIDPFAALVISCCLMSLCRMRWLYRTHHNCVAVRFLRLLFILSDRRLLLSLMLLLLLVLLLLLLILVLFFERCCQWWLVVDMSFMTWSFAINHPTNLYRNERWSTIHNITKRTKHT